MSVAQFQTPALWRDTGPVSPPQWWDGSKWVFDADALPPGCISADDVTPYDLPAGSVIQYNITTGSGSNSPLTVGFFNAAGFSAGVTIGQIELSVDGAIGSGEIEVETAMEGVIAWAVFNTYSGPSTPAIDSVAEITFAEPDPDEEAEDTVNFNCECEDTNDNLTLAEYRERMLVRSGFAAVAANPPPGVSDLFNTFLQDSQTFIYRKYPALRTRRFFRWRMQEGVRFYGMQENDENWIEANVTLGAASPGTVTFSTAAPAAARQIQFWPIEGSELPPEITAYQRYYVVSPVGAACSVAETEGGDPLDFTESFEAYASYSPGAACVFNMEPYKNIEGAWVEDVNGTWLPLTEGIPGTFYTTVTQNGIPLRFEIRQCVEVFPGPNSNDYKLWLKGHFGLASFTEDTDKPTIDGHLVYLFALAEALAYYGKPNAVNAMAQAREYLGELVAGTHGAKRYVPGTTAIPPAVMPVLLPLPGT